MPTPIKYDNPAIGNAYKATWRRWRRASCSTCCRRSFRGWYGPILTQSDPEVRQVVKAADKLSAYINGVEELKAGNNEFRQAAGRPGKPWRARTAGSDVLSGDLYGQLPPRPWTSCSEQRTALGTAPGRFLFTCSA